MNFLEAWQEYGTLKKVHIQKDDKKQVWSIDFNDANQGDEELQKQMVLAFMPGVSVYEDINDFNRIENDAYFSISKKNKQLLLWKGETWAGNEATISYVKCFENEIALYLYIFDEFKHFDESLPIKLGIPTPDALFHKSMMEGNQVRIWGYHEGGNEHGELTYLVSEKLPNGNYRFYEVWHPQPDYIHNRKIYSYFQIEPIDECTPRWTEFLQDYKAGKNVKENAETWELTAEEYEAKKEGGFKIGDNFTPL